MLATANGLKESLGEYWTDGLVILWLKPRSGTRRSNQRPPSTSVREIISSNGGFNLRFYIPLICDALNVPFTSLFSFAGEFPHGQLKGMTAVDIYHAIEQDDRTKEGSNNH